MTDERPTEPTPLTNPADPPPLTNPADQPAPLMPQQPVAPLEPASPPVSGWPSSETPAQAPAAGWMPPSAAPAPPPAVAWQAPAAPMVAAPGMRTGWAAGAGVAMIVLAVLGGLLGLLTIVGGAMINSYVDLSQFSELGSNPGGVVSTMFTIVGVVVIVYSLVYLIGGIGVLRSRDWGRVVGIVVGVLSGLFWLAAVGGSGSAASGNAQSGIAFPLVLLLIHAYIVVVLIAFWRARRTA